MTDFRLIYRQWLRHPGFAVVTGLTLALGIGANTIVFSVARAVLFRPLGFVDADRLMWIRLANRETGITENLLSWRDFEDIRESSQSLESMALFGEPGTSWNHGDRLELLRP
jgi:putative ABC transport system permease protein